jgi:hypothetical protein
MLPGPGGSSKRHVHGGGAGAGGGVLGHASIGERQRNSSSSSSGRAALPTWLVLVAVVMMAFLMGVSLSSRGPPREDLMNNPVNTPILAVSEGTIAPVKKITAKSGEGDEEAGDKPGKKQQHVVQIQLPEVLGGGNSGSEREKQREKEEFAAIKVAELRKAVELRDEEDAVERRKAEKRRLMRLDAHVRRPHGAPVRFRARGDALASPAVIGTLPLQSSCVVFPSSKAVAAGPNHDEPGAAVIAGGAAAKDAASAAEGKKDPLDSTEANNNNKKNEGGTSPHAERDEESAQQATVVAPPVSSSATSRFGRPSQREHDALADIESMDGLHDMGRRRDGGGGGGKSGDLASGGGGGGGGEDKSVRHPPDWTWEMAVNEFNATLSYRSGGRGGERAHVDVRVFPTATVPPFIAVTANPQSERASSQLHATGDFEPDKRKLLEFLFGAHCSDEDALPQKLISESESEEEPSASPSSPSGEKSHSGDGDGDGDAPRLEKATATTTRTVPVVLDIGGGFGFVSLYAAAMGCRAIAFEPQPRLASVIDFAATMNDARDRILVVGRPVSDVDNVPMRMWRQTSAPAPVVASGSNSSSAASSSSPEDAEAALECWGCVAVEEVEDQPGSGKDSSSSPKKAPPPASAAATDKTGGPTNNATVRAGESSAEQSAADENGASRSGFRSLLQDSGQEVISTRLDKHILKSDQVVLLHISAEGHEVRVLESLLSSLSAGLTVRNIVLDWCPAKWMHSVQRGNEVLKKLADAHGFRIWHFGERLPFDEKITLGKDFKEGAGRLWEVPHERVGTMNEQLLARGVEATARLWLEPVTVAAAPATPSPAT